MATRRRRTRPEERLSSGYKKPSAPNRRPVKRRLLYALRVLSGLSAALGVVAVIIWVVLSYNLRSINVMGVDNEAGIRTAATEYLDTNQLSTNLFLLDTRKLQNSLAEQFSAEYARVQVRREWHNRSLSIEVEPRRPALVWSTRNQRYVMDENGVIMADGTPGKGLLRVRDQSNLPAAVGTQAAPSHFVGFVREAYGLLKDNSRVGPAAIRVRDTTAEVFIDTKQGYYIRFDTNSSAQDQVENVETILAGGANPVDYIDVRLPHKAYWR